MKKCAARCNQVPGYSLPRLLRGACCPPSPPSSRHTAAAPSPPPPPGGTEGLPRAGRARIGLACLPQKRRRPQSKGQGAPLAAPQSTLPSHLPRAPPRPPPTQSGGCGAARRCCAPGASEPPAGPGQKTSGRGGGRRVSGACAGKEAEDGGAASGGGREGCGGAPQTGRQEGEHSWMAAGVRWGMRCACGSPRGAGRETVL
jgi:hypothetical protein